MHKLKLNLPVSGARSKENMRLLGELYGAFPTKAIKNVIDDNLREMLQTPLGEIPDS